MQKAESNNIIMNINGIYKDIHEIHTVTGNLGMMEFDITTNAVLMSSSYSCTFTGDYKFFINISLNDLKLQFNKASEITHSIDLKNFLTDIHFSYKSDPTFNPYINTYRDWETDRKSVV